MRNPALFARLFNTPLLIHSAKLDAIIAGIGGRFGLADHLPDTGKMVVPKMALTQSGDSIDRGFQQIGTVGVIDIIGVLAHRGGFQADSSYVLGYDRIGAQLNEALADPSIHSILLQIDSPGGEVAGAFELAAQIKAASQIKPVNAVISSLSASAGYLLASAANEIAISETGYAGSIGVVMRHVDMSKMAEQDGISVTYIYAGDRKIDGHPFAPLPAAVKADFQQQIDKLYGLFVRTVSENRSLSADSVRAQQAAIYSGHDAIAAGLADRIATPDQVLGDMQSLSSNQRRNTMSVPNAIEKPALEQQALDSSRAEGFTAGQQAGFADGVKAERERITAILTHTEAQGREEQAKVFALESDMSADMAARVLAKSPKIEAAEAEGQSQFAAAMTKLGNPKIDPGDDDGDDEGGEEAQARAGWAKAVSLYAKPQVINGGRV